MRNLKGLRKIKNGVYVPCLILCSLFILAWVSEASFIDNFENYDPIIEREATSYIPVSSDMSVFFSNIEVNPSTQEIAFSLTISAWLDINLTEITVRVDTTYSTDFLTLYNHGRATRIENGDWWGWFYSPETPIYVKEKLVGFTQSYPYDVYSVSVTLMFITYGSNPTFNQNFQPSVSTPAMRNWKVGTYSKPIDLTSNNFILDVGVNVARDTTIDILQFMIPTTAIYLIMGFSITKDSSDKLKERITLFLTISVLTLSLYTFLLRQFDTIPLFVQNIAISLVVSNIILFVFSIISSSHRRIRRNWDVWALFLASLTPIFYLLLSAYSLMNYLLQVVIADNFKLIESFFSRYIDYRFLLWFIIFQLAFWMAYLSKTYLFKRKAIVPVTFFSGIGLILVNSLKAGFAQEIIFFVIGLVMIIVSAILFFSKISRKISEQSTLELFK